jgi:glycosyltransferase involved in cell wall biosynthesis
MTSKNILIVTSTFPASHTDPVPTFVKDHVIAMSTLDPTTKFTVLSPHDQRSNTQSYSVHAHYDEYRFHYIWPRGLERLSGQGGIVPSLKKHHWLYFVIPFFVLAQFFAVIRIANKTKPDIINAHWIIPQGFVCMLAGFITHKKVVATVHGSDVFTFNNLLARGIKRFVLKNATKIIVNSSATKERSAELYNGRKYEIIPMGVTLDTFKGIRETTSNSLNILFVGRLSEEKGVKYLIEALAILKRRGIKFQTRIIGSGPEENQLKQLAESYGLNQKNIEFTGWVNRNNIINHYKWANVFIGPSITSKTGGKEALGVVFLEASAASLPIIATRTGGIIDIIKDGETGFLVNEKSAAGICHKLIELQDPKLRERLGKNAQRYVSDNFSWESVAKQYNKMFETI